MNKDGDRSEASEQLKGACKQKITPRDDNDGLTIDLHGDLAGILNMTKENNDMSKTPMLKRLQLLQANDNSPAEAFQDSVGCGGSQSTCPAIFCNRADRAKNNSITL